MTNFLLFVLVISLWLVPQIYFLYCLEKRRPWARDVARAMTLHDRAVNGDAVTDKTERLGSQQRNKQLTQTTPMAVWQRADVWTNWL